MKRLLLALVLLAGCSSKPEQVEVKVTVEESPLMKAAIEEAKVKAQELKKKNDTIEAYLKAIDALKAEAATDPTTKERCDAAVKALAAEALRITDQAKQDSFLHDEVVGKSLDEFLNKWSPKPQTEDALPSVAPAAVR